MGAKNVKKTIWQWQLAMSKAVFNMVFCFHPACKLSIEEYANLNRENKVVVTGDPTGCNQWIA